MSLKNFLAAAVLALVASTPVYAASTACSEQFAGGVAPDVVNPKIAAKTRELCFRQFDVLHSGVSRTPLWSAEHLTAARIEAARDMERDNLFHEEDRLPPDERSWLADFKRSGYDRGHMSPSGDQPDEESQAESFSLANMVPQAPQNNRGIWERIESAVRDWTVDEGELYVITGPAFVGGNLERLNGRVLVPTHVWKAVYSPRQKRAGAYVTVNGPGDEWQSVSMTELRNMTGLDVFPGLPQAVKDGGMDLPSPAAKRRHRSH